MYEIHYMAEEHNPRGSSSNLHGLITMRYLQSLTIYSGILWMTFSLTAVRRGGEGTGANRREKCPGEWGVSPLAVSSESHIFVCFVTHTFSKPMVIIHTLALAYINHMLKQSYEQTGDITKSFPWYPASRCQWSNIVNIDIFLKLICLCNPSDID